MSCVVLSINEFIVVGDLVMSKSQAFLRIRRGVFKIVGSIPSGKVTTYRDIGEYMTIMPRHVVYISGQLDPHEQDNTPWHRVVGLSGKLGKERRNARGLSQEALFFSDGVIVFENKVTKFEAVFVSVRDLGSGVKPAQDYTRAI